MLAVGLGLLAIAGGVVGGSYAKDTLGHDPGHASQVAVPVVASPTASTRAAPQQTAAERAAPKKKASTKAAPKKKPGAESTTADTLVVPTKGSGKLVQARSAVPARTKKGRLIRFDVKVEKGLPFDPADTARFMATVLNDPRSWDGDGTVRFQLVADRDDAELHAYVVSAETTDAMCAPLLTQGKVSCQTGRKVVLNASRWGHGAKPVSKAFGDDVTAYRRYLVNHEFGHYLGYGHVGCPGKGRTAPVMMQQTKGLQRCVANSWPAPGRGGQGSR